MTTDLVRAVFVYGTLKRGQCRQSCWPAVPLAVDKAWTLGELYDTGPYPALFPGEEPVAGELWTFAGDAIVEVLRELDEVEEFRPDHEETNLYNREVIQCTDQRGTIHHAHSYFYNRRSEKPFFRRIRPTHVWAGRAFAVWPVGGDW